MRPVMPYLDVFEGGGLQHNFTIHHCPPRSLHFKINSDRRVFRMWSGLYLKILTHTLIHTLTHTQTSQIFNLELFRGTHPI